MSAPRVKTLRLDRDEAWYRYKGHDIEIRRQNRRDDWYISVRNDAGQLAYDGWWEGSAGKPKRAVVLEALNGAMLYPRANQEKGHAE